MEGLLVKWLRQKKRIITEGDKASVLPEKLEKMPLPAPPAPRALHVPGT